jgi:hypothetical protein
LLSETKLTTRQLAEKYKDEFFQNGYIQYIEERTRNEYNKLKLKKDELTNDSSFMQEQLQMYSSQITERIIEQYGSSLPLESVQLLKNVKINTINNPEYKHDMSALLSGEIIANIAMLEGNDICEKTVKAKGMLAHEIFHLIIPMLKVQGADERMVIDLVNGNQIRSLGMVGFMLNEGMAEKFSTEFCRQNDFYCTLGPQHIPYINICNYILERSNAKPSIVFYHKYDDMLKYLSQEEKQAYLISECVSFAVRHKGVKPEEILNVRVENINSNKVVVSKQNFNKETSDLLSNEDNTMDKTR